MPKHHLWDTFHRSAGHVPTCACGFPEILEVGQLALSDLSRYDRKTQITPRKLGLIGSVGLSRGSALMPRGYQNNCPVLDSTYPSAQRF